MKRSLSLITIVLILSLAAWLGGCGSSDSSGTVTTTADTGTQNTRSASSTSTNSQIGTPQVGTHNLKPFISLLAETFPDGMVAFGFNVKGGMEKPILSVVRPDVDGASWDEKEISADGNYPFAAAAIGSTQVLVGENQQNGPPGSPQVPFLAMASPATRGIFKIQDLGQAAFGGKSAALNDVNLTGDPKASGTEFIMVGATVNSQNGELGNPTGTRPVAFTSPDGETWLPTADLPLPAGVTGAEALSVTPAASGTAYPGVVVVGDGWADDAKIGRRDIVIIWTSPDGGKSWKAVSDGNFSEEGRNLTASHVAADAHTIVVAGFGEVLGGSPGQQAAIDWAISSDGKVSSSIDTLDPNRNSRTTALIARPGGGFLTATQIFDIGVPPTQAGQDPVGNPLASAWSSADGINWTDQTEAIKDLASTMVISGIAEFGGRAAFFGDDTASAPKAYVVDSSTLK